VFAQRGSAGYVPQVNQGQSSLARHQWSAAASHFRFALQWDRSGVAAHNGLGEAYLHLGRREGAAEEFEAALRLSPHSAEAERGIRAARSEGEAEAAFDELQEQVQREPGNADAHTTLAEELLDRHQPDAAAHEAESALKLDRKQGHAYCVLGRIAAQHGDLDVARKNLGLAILLDSTDDDAYSTLGDLAMRDKDFPRAVQYYRHVVSIAPDETEGHKGLRDALTALGQTREAAKETAILNRLKEETSQ
jgi:Tfp pilus assembly protein PilF